MKDFTDMNRKYLAAAAAIVLVAGGTGYLLMDGDESAPGGEQAAAPSSATEAAPPSRIEMSADRIKIAEIGLFQVGDAGFGSERSEEHTSELQSLMRISYAVFCLKKKTKTNNQS